MYDLYYIDYNDSIRPEALLERPLFLLRRNLPHIHSDRELATVLYDSPLSLGPRFFSITPSSCIPRGHTLCPFPTGACLTHCSAFAIACETVFNILSVSSTPTAKRT